MIRLFDILFSTIGLLLLSPLFLVIYIIIIIESKGGGFYSQTRIGKNGIPFAIYKFRSMRTDADKHGLITVGGRDPRITRIGYYIRKYKIDELPQLWNVLVGDMSLVGPRPEVQKYVDLYTEEQRKVLSVRPGITDYASIEYVDENILLAKSDDPDRTYVEVVMPAKIVLNMKYINNKSLKEYFKIIFLTLAKIVG
ncbi:sugar transferase [Prevotella koreensis]|uniref:Sugar transferase n=1 Tax=Prevotella koreensis TaxID=2490854 RepID=A0A3S0R9D0_9BACT|nr:sugar transferase [Prevotella koreensis]RUL58470.1 sugar transferase [Prevotella koreensis]